MVINEYMFKVINRIMRPKLRLISYKWGYYLACVWHFVFSAVWNFLENSLEISYIEATSKAISKATIWIENLSFHRSMCFHEPRPILKSQAWIAKANHDQPSNTNGDHQTQPKQYSTAPPPHTRPRGHAAAKRKSPRRRPSASARQDAVNPNKKIE